MHQLDFTENWNLFWLACLSKGEAGCHNSNQVGRLSFLVLNLNSFQNGTLQLYESATAGYLGKDEVLSNFVTCSFPQDGGTLSRNASGCGCFLPDADFACHDGYAWCDDVPKKKEAYQIGECAYKPQETTTMLHEYAKSGSKYNEVIVNGTQWNSAIQSHQCPIWAFVYPNTTRCTAKAHCCSKVVKQWRKYNEQTGCGAPLLTIDVTSRFAPFVHVTADMVSCNPVDEITLKPPQQYGVISSNMQRMFYQVAAFACAFLGALMVKQVWSPKKVRQPLLTT
jgi:hypothetical protein